MKSFRLQESPRRKAMRELYKIQPKATCQGKKRKPTDGPESIGKTNDPIQNSGKEKEEKILQGDDKIGVRKRAPKKPKYLPDQSQGKAKDQRGQDQRNV